MSKETTNLKLYKLEASDGDSTFNIDKVLNQNWDKIDIDSKDKEDRLKSLENKKHTWGNLKGV